MSENFLKMLQHTYTCAHKNKKMSAVTFLFVCLFVCVHIVKKMEHLFI